MTPDTRRDVHSFHSAHADPGGRFPDGDVEHRSTRGEVPVGTTIRSRGVEWRITRFENDAAFLEAAEEAAAGAPGGALPGLDPLGDTTLTVEILTEA